MLRLKHKTKLRLGEEISCRYWDFERYLWSSKGCYKVEEESDLFTTVCKCNHLTNFAALMDMSGREENDDLKQKLTYFCSGLSIVGLIMTIIIILKPKKVGKRDLRMESNRKLRDIIACNLCICLLIVNILVVSALNRLDIKVKV